MATLIETRELLRFSVGNGPLACGSLDRSPWLPELVSAPRLVTSPIPLVGSTFTCRRADPPSPPTDAQRSEGSLGRAPRGQASLRSGRELVRQKVHTPCSWMHLQDMLPGRLLG